MFITLAELKETVREFRADRPLELAAAVSYYSLLSLAPIVLVAVALAALVFEREAVEGQVVAEMRGLVGESGAEVIQTVLRSANSPVKSKISLAIGIVTLLAGATTVFVQVQDAMNRIWDVEARPKQSAWWIFARERLMSLAMVLGIGFLLLVSLLVSAALTAVGDWAGSSFQESPVIRRAIELVISVGVITMLFAMIFKWLPDAKVAWRNVWFGALTTAVLFTLGKYLIGLYLGHASVGSAYGAAGSVVVILVWVYYASLIVFFGAELTHVRSKRKEGRIRPVEYAVKTRPASG